MFIENFSYKVKSAQDQQWASMVLAGAYGMADLHIDSLLLEKLKQTAQERSMSVEEFLEKAVHSYLRQLEEEELERNVEAYNKLHPGLVKDYSGQYVAIHAGELVDHDPDFPVLHRRIRQRYGRQPILLRRVDQEKETVWTRP